MSFAIGVGGTELGRGINSVDADGKLNDFKFDVLCADGCVSKPKKKNRGRENKSEPIMNRNQ